MSTLMRSPDGQESQIKPAGVAAMKNMGWTSVEPPKPARSVSPDEGGRPAPVRKPRKSN